MKKEIVVLEDGRRITVNELKISDVANALDNISDTFSEDFTDPKVLQRVFKEKYQLILDVAEGFILMPENETVKDLTFSEIMELQPVFMRVNESFLAMTGFLETAESPVEKQETSQENSIEP